MPSFPIYSLGNYSFGTKEEQVEADPTVEARLERLEKEYKEVGMRRSVEAVMIVYEHRHPHILTLQVADSFFRIPGDQLQPNEDEVEGLKRILNSILSPPNPVGDWEVSDCLIQWWRPNYDVYNVTFLLTKFPYLPPHITRPKENKKVFLVKLPEKKLLAVPNNMKLLAVPLFELYDNAQRYGAQLSVLPQILSRYDFQLK